MTNPFIYLFVQMIKDVLTKPHLAIPVALLALGITGVVVWLRRRR